MHGRGYIDSTIVTRPRYAPSHLAPPPPDLRSQVHLSVVVPWCKVAWSSGCFKQKAGVIADMMERQEGLVRRCGLTLSNLR
jgi:hypothetical protein